MLVFFARSIPVFAEEAPRVRHARTHLEGTLQKELEEKGMKLGDPVFLRVFKKERDFEIWIQAGAKGDYVLFKRFPVCYVPGSLGPKRRRGDNQVPEGLYTINRFNPYSNYHLSLGVNYPNPADRGREGPGKNLGGDIFIHGDCVSIGCIPLTDKRIEEVYLLALEAKNKGHIPVHIFPFKMTESNMLKYAQDPSYPFWTNLRAAFDSFEQTHRIPKFTINQKSGHYIVSP